MALTGVNRCCCGCQPCLSYSTSFDSATQFASCWLGDGMGVSDGNILVGSSGFNSNANNTAVLNYTGIDCALEDSETISVKCTFFEYINDAGDMSGDAGGGLFCQVGATSAYMIASVIDDSIWYRSGTGYPYSGWTDLGVSPSEDDIFEIRATLNGTSSIDYDFILNGTSQDTSNETYVFDLFSYGFYGFRDAAADNGGHVRFKDFSTELV